MEQRQIDRLLAALEGLVKSGTGGVRPSRAASYDDSDQDSKRQAKLLGAAQEDVRKAFENLAKTSKAETDKYKAAQQAYNQALEDAAEAQKQSNKKDKKLREAQRDGLAAQYYAFKDLATQTEGLSSKLALAQKNASLFAASLIETHSEIDESTEHYKNYIESLGKSASLLDKKVLQEAKLLDEFGDGLSKNLSASHFAQLRKSLGNAQTLIAENLSKIGIEEDLGKFLKSGEFQQRLSASGTEMEKSAEKFHETLVVIAKQLQAQGHLGGVDLSSPNKINTADLAKQVADASDKINAATVGLDKNGTNASTALGTLSRGIPGVKAAFAEHIKGLTKTTAIMGGLSKMVDAAKEGYKQAADFNIAQIPASFMEVQAASVRLGMSFEETVTFLKDNKRLLAVYGTEQGSALMGSLKDTFATFGYSAKQAAEIMPGAVESAIGAGVNIRSGDQLNKFIGDTMQSFKSISGIVDISAKEYANLNAELFTSSDIQGTLVGMGQEQAAAYSKQLEGLRNNYVQMGLSTQQAQELVKAQEAQKREKVTSRVRAAAKAQVMAQQLGMGGEEAARYAQLRRKAFTTKEEKMEMAQMEKRMAAAAEQRMQSEYARGEGAGMAFQTTMEGLMEGTDMQSRLETGTKLAAAEKSGKAMTEAEAAEKGEAAKGSESFAKLQNIVNSASSIMSNVFTGGLIGASTALIGFAAQLMMARGALASIAGGGLDLPDGPDGKRGKPGGKSKMARIANAAKSVGGRALGTAARFAGPVAAVAGAGMAGWEVGTYLNENVLSEETKSGIGDVIGGTMSYIPGTEAWDLRKEREAREAAAAQTSRSASGTIKPAMPAGPGATVNTPAPIAGERAAAVVAAAKTAAGAVPAATSIMNASDTVTHQKLTEIAQTLAASLQVLQQMAGPPGGATTGRQMTRPTIPTAISALSGAC